MYSIKLKWKTYIYKNNIFRSYTSEILTRVGKDSTEDDNPRVSGNITTEIPFRHSPCGKLFRKR